MKVGHNFHRQNYNGNFCPNTGHLTELSSNLKNTLMICQYKFSLVSRDLKVWNVQISG